MPVEVYWRPWGGFDATLPDVWSLVAAATGLVAVLALAGLLDALLVPGPVPDADSDEPDHERPRAARLVLVTPWLVVAVVWLAVALGLAWLLGRWFRFLRDDERDW